MKIARVSKEGIDLASNMKMLLKGYPFLLEHSSNRKALSPRQRVQSPPHLIFYSISQIFD